MAKTLEIITNENAAKIVVDGNEISDVMSYRLSEDGEGTVLELKIAITDRAHIGYEPAGTPDEPVHKCIERILAKEALSHGAVLKGTTSCPSTQRGSPCKMRERKFKDIQPVIQEQFSRWFSKE